MGHILFFLQAVDACIYCSRALFPSLVSFSYSLSLSCTHTDRFTLFLSHSLPNFFGAGHSTLLSQFFNFLYFDFIMQFNCSIMHPPLLSQSLSHSFSFKCTCSHHSLLVFSRCYTHKHILLLFLKFCLVGALCFCHFPLFIMFAFMVVKE